MTYHRGDWNRKVDWSTIDWDKSGGIIKSELADQGIAISRQRIEQVRKSHGHRAGLLGMHGTTYSAYLALRAGKFDGKPIRTVQQETGLSYITIKRLCCKHGFAVDYSPIPFRQPTKFDLAAINWDLPNSDIERIYSMSYNYAGVHRYSHKLPLSRWKKWQGVIPTDPEYHRAIEAETCKVVQE